MYYDSRHRDGAHCAPLARKHELDQVKIPRYSEREGWGGLIVSVRARSSSSIPWTAPRVRHDANVIAIMPQEKRRLRTGS